jgi:hypothetical protein
MLTVGSPKQPWLVVQAWCREARLFLGGHFSVAIVRAR